ncbi:hypothetical protein FRB93_001170 [Tulasnella sp. JGI-2019a]|nr:hypothetical protein FRB93_001170 [Tulasnella sp. JGI-2019a]
MAPKGKKGRKRHANNRGGHEDHVADQVDAKPAVTVADALPTANDASDDSEDLCWICTEKIKYFSFSECNHITCHICALRMRALYKREICTFCKLPQTSLVITSRSPKPYQGYNLQSMQHFDRKLSMYCETGEMLKNCLLLLRSNCPNSDCDFTTLGWASLKRHVSDCHDRLLCDLCISHKKIFAHEHTTYTVDQYPIHMPSFQRSSNRKGKGKEVQAEVQTDMEIHPMCSFCQECFYDDDELHSHLRGRHEECFVCRKQGIVHQYFQDLVKLELHFKEEHHPCTNPLCLEQKFMVFPTELDLKAHLAEVHGNAKKTKKNRQKPQRLEMSFETPSYAESRREGNWGRERAGSTHSTVYWPRWGAPSDAPTSPSTSYGIWDQPDPEHARKYAIFLDHVRSVVTSVDGRTAIRLAVASWRSSESPVYEVMDTIFDALDWDMDKISGVVVRLLDVSQGEKEEELSAYWNAFCRRLSALLSDDQRQDRQLNDYSSWESVPSIRDSVTPGARRGGTFWDRIEVAAEEEEPVGRPRSGSVRRGASSKLVPGLGVATRTASGGSFSESAFPALSSGRTKATNRVAESSKSWAAVAASSRRLHSVPETQTRDSGMGGDQISDAQFATASVDEQSAIRLAITSWHSSESLVYEMLDTIFTVLDWDMDKITGVVMRLLDISEGEKREELLEFWNDFLNILAPGSGYQRRDRPTTNYSSSSRRVPSAEHSVRSRGQRNGTFWDRVEVTVEEEEDSVRAGPSSGSVPFRVSGRPVPGSQVAISTAGRGSFSGSAFPALSSGRPTATKSAVQNLKSWAAVAAPSRKPYSVPETQRRDARIGWDEIAIPKNSRNITRGPVGGGWTLP